MRPIPPFGLTCISVAAGVAYPAVGGDPLRFDVSFNDIDIFANSIDGNAVVTNTAEPGRYFDSFGWANVDVDVCWNLGSSYSGWASEVNFAMTMDDGTGTSLVTLGSPFAGDHTGSNRPDSCVTRLALGEVQNEFPPFTYHVDDSTGDVSSGMMSTWSDGTGERHSHCNTADFFFVLGLKVPIECGNAFGSCAQVHSTPGCADKICCALTCDADHGGDPYCCDVLWDSICVEIATDLCDLFQYTCDAPAYENDCVSGAIMLANGDTIAFDTTGANTDGPDQAECGSSYEDLPIWSDLWYMIQVEADADITATCCNSAFFNTKLAIYDAGAIGDSFDPATLRDAFLTCNDDCGNDAGTYFTSEAFLPAATGGRQYLIRVGGYAGEIGTGDLTVSWTEPEPPLPAPECTTPGGTAITQFVTDTPTVSGGVWCGAGAENVVARTFSADELGGAFDVSCVDFGYFYVDEGYFPCVINLYRSNQQSPVGATIELLGTTSCGIYGVAGYTLGSQSFEAPVGVDLAAGEYLMVEVRLQRQLADNAGTGYGGYFGCTLADTGGSEGYISCGGDYFGSMSEIGYPDHQPFISFNGDAGGGCTGDLNNDGFVDGADLGQLFSQWGACPGECPADFDGNSSVGGEDLGTMLQTWGACGG